MKVRRYLAVAIGLSLLIGSIGVYTFTRPVPQVFGNSVSMLTQHNDSARSGANLNETILNTTNVNVNNFGKLFTRSVDGSIYTQPLYVAGVTIPNKGVHNVVYVGTMHDTVYAFDADDPNQSTPLWLTSLGASVTLPSGSIGSNCGTYKDISTEIGIIGTPVIDNASGTLYVVAFTKESGNYIHRLHALDITTGQHKASINGGQPIVISGSVNGTGAGSSGGTIAFNSSLQNQRPGLLLANGNVYVGFASYCDTGNYHGWLISYNAANLTQSAITNLSPNGNQAGLWMAGQGPSFDGSYIYVMVGNGTSDTSNPQNFGEAFVKLDPSTLAMVDWFIPYNYAALNTADSDLGSSGPLLLPGTHYLVGGGKQGRLYLLDVNNMGHFQAGSDSQIKQSFGATQGHIHGSPVYWNGPNGPRIYVWGEYSYFKSFAYNTITATFTTTAVSTSTIKAPNGMPGGMLSVSANGSQAGTGIVWASLPYNADANQAVVEGELHAFDANDLTHELWNSKMNDTRDHYGNFGKFAPPTVINGKVYMATFSNLLDVYGTFTPVTIANDDGAATTPGTLSYALSVAGVGQTITFNLGAGTTITEATGLVVPTGVNIDGGCTNGIPGITIDGTTASAGSDGLKLTGNTLINGLKITGFSGRELFVTGNANKATCVIAHK